MRDQPEQQAPPVQRLRVRYAKRGRMRFTSHRDFARAFERAVARARLPMAYSSGFHPHPRISYAGASPTGAASEAEYLEIGLNRECSVEEVRTALDAAMPPGLDVVAVAVSPGGSLSDLLTASRWRTRLAGVSAATAQTAVDSFLLRTEVLVERMTKRGLREFDCRAAVASLEVTPSSEECAILEMVVRHGTPSVRPDDILAGLVLVSGLDVRSVAVHERVAQGSLDEATGTVQDPLALNRDTA